MSDLFVIPSKLLISGMSIADLMSHVDAGGFHQLNSTRADEWLLAENHRHDAPVSGPRVFSDGRWTAVFAGDLVGHDVVPFRQVITALDTKSWEFLAELNGIFAFAVYDSQSEQLFTVSDRRSQKPLFYMVGPRGLRISTCLAVFARLSEEPEFDRKWFWQLLYFNFPVDDSTYLENVKRVPPACVMAFDCLTGELSMGRYAELPGRSGPLLKGKESLQLAAQIFGTCVPAHYRGAHSVACALTGGWDGRTMLALAPSDKAVTAYTYGGPGCTDMVDAKATAKEIGVDHLGIPFDQSFVEELPRHALETVYMSSGLLGVLRSTLHHAYREMTDVGQRLSLTISGISLGTQLRGSAQFPDLISAEVAEHFRGQGSALDMDYWRAIVGKDEVDFSEFISSRLKLLKEKFGPFESPEHHLTYIMYPASAHYFCGELVLADHFTTVRVPAWDSKVVDLMYAIEHSTLSFSKFVKQNQSLHSKQMVLQAYLLKSFSPALYRVPVRGIHPSAIIAGEFPYQAERAYRAVMRRILDRSAKSESVPLENWDVWLFDRNRQFMTGLLQSSETLVGDFVERSFIDQVIANRDVRLLGKLLTTEIILRLIRNRWERFW
jgi:hypothetical protein